MGNKSSTTLAAFVTAPEFDSAIIAETLRHLSGKGKPSAIAGSFENATRGPMRNGRKPRAATRTAHRDQATLDTLIPDCEAIARNNHLVRATLSCMRDVVVGHAPAIEATGGDAEWRADVERRFRDWADSVLPDAFGTMGFWDLAGDVVTRWETSGGVLRHFVKEPDRPLAVELIDVYRLRNQNGTRDTETMKGGVETDGARPVAYHVADWDPAGISLRRTDTRRLAHGPADLINSPRLLGAGQYRAEPGLSTVVDRYEKLNVATDASFTAYVVAASIALTVERDQTRSAGNVESQMAQAMVDAGYADSVEDAIETGYMDAGMFFEASPGDKIGQVDSKHPSAPFQEAFWMELQALCAAVDLPVELVFYRYIRNWSASRSAIATAWRRIQSRQDALRRRFVVPTWRAWLRGEIADKRIPFVPDWDRCEVRLATMPVLEPKQEIEALTMKLAAKLTTHEAALAELGITDRAAFMQKLATEKAEADAIGITVGEQPVQKTVSVNEDDPSAGPDGGGDEDGAADGQSEAGGGDGKSNP